MITGAGRGEKGETEREEETMQPDLSFCPGSAVSVFRKVFQYYIDASRSG